MPRHSIKRRIELMSKHDEERHRFWEEKYDQIDDVDLSIGNAWERQQNMEATAKLLEMIRKHHKKGDPYARV